MTIGNDVGSITLTDHSFEVYAYYFSLGKRVSSSLRFRDNFELVDKTITIR